jgi:hypothetical protein
MSSTAPRPVPPVDPSGDLGDVPPASKGRAARRRQLARWKKSQRRALVATAVALVGGGLTVASMDRGSGSKPQAASAPDDRTMGMAGDNAAQQPPVQPPAQPSAAPHATHRQQPGTGHPSTHATHPTQAPVAAAPQQQAPATVTHTVQSVTHQVVHSAVAAVSSHPAAPSATPSHTAAPSSGSAAQQPSASASSGGTGQSTSSAAPAQASTASTSPSEVCLLGLLCVR